MIFLFNFHVQTTIIDQQVAIFVMFSFFTNRMKTKFILVIESETQQFE